MNLGGPLEAFQHLGTPTLLMVLEQISESYKELPVLPAADFVFDHLVYNLTSLPLSLCFMTLPFASISSLLDRAADGPSVYMSE